MSYSRLILKDSADVVWGLDDLKSETASFSVPLSFLDNSASYYSASINASATNLIQTPIIFGGETSLELTSSVNACISIPALNLFSELYSKREYSLEFWLKIDKIPNSEITIVKKRNSSNTGLFLRDNYLIYRYGNSSSFIETYYGLGELDQPTHIVMNYNSDRIELLVNGISSKIQIDSFNTSEIDYSHSTNNYLDFYGNSAFSVIIDSIAIYPYRLSRNTAKRHYVYGLGKNISESTFTNMGGVFFNISTDQTKKSYYEYWDTTDKWHQLSYDNLILTNDGIRSQNYLEPTLGTLDNKVTKISNQIKFYTTSSTIGSYIDIENFNILFNQKSNIFFTKLKLDGERPATGSYQTLISFGLKPFNEVFNFNLKNISGSYYIQAYHVQSASTISFYIPSITSSPTVYLGAKFDGQTTIYYAASSGNIESASFTTYSGSVYGTDLLSGYIPLSTNSVLRIGSRYSFDTIVTASQNANQFLGSFDSLMFVDKKFTGSSYSDIDSFNKYVYKTYFDTNDNRFKILTFGTASFIIAGSRIVETDFSGSGYISSNRFEFGYPDSVSGSQVQIFVSMYDYSGNTIKTREKIQKVNFFEWLNLINLYDKYVKFDIEMLSKDIAYYPPVVKYFNAEAYPYSASYTDVLGYTRSSVRIRNGASAQSYIPEFTQTPTIFLTDKSGIKSNKNYIDVNFQKGNIGTLGFFIRPNTDSTSTKIIEIFSSSALTTSLFSASIQSNVINTSSVIGTPIINGNRSSTLINKNWNHISFIFNPKLETASTNYFVIRFGDENNSNFNIQNIYILDTLLESIDISYLHNGFVGGSAVISAKSAASAITLIDRDESRHSNLSASIGSTTLGFTASNVVFQPALVQKRFLCQVIAATTTNASDISISKDFDSVDFETSIPDPNKVLFLTDNKIYSISISNGVKIGTEVTTVNGDYVTVLDGVSNKNKLFVKVDGVFTEYPKLLKLNSYDSPKEPSQ